MGNGFADKNKTFLQQFSYRQVLKKRRVKFIFALFRSTGKGRERIGYLYFTKSTKFFLFHIYLESNRNCMIIDHIIARLCKHINIQLKTPEYAVSTELAPKTLLELHNFKLNDP